MINSNISLAQKNLISRVSQHTQTYNLLQVNSLELKQGDLEKLAKDTSIEIKNRFAATSWMNSLAGGNGGAGNTELMRMNAEREEENQKTTEKRFLEMT